MDIEKVVAKRDEYAARKAKFVKDAQAELSAYNGALTVLNELIAEAEQEMADEVEFEAESPESAISVGEKIIEAIDKHCAEYPEDCEPVEEAVNSAP